MKNRKKTKAEQIDRIQKAIKKFGDWDGSRAKKLAELRAK